ncbi:class I SAM-dependent methyltransferase [Candidatus Dojkabacteria bacterium]|jgi:ubiquinone/menaquinone biosynthesis C-methylase UbiE|nr:class I SAM-dependent methyltransferase [Candidatus Dojkabacteria bacterium]
MNKQEYFRDEYRKIKPKWLDSSSIYKGLINKYLKKDGRVLDIGCGHGTLLKDVYAKTLYTYGIDPDKEALAKNTFIKNKKVGFVEELPYQDKFFDVVVCAWVLEHLKSPETAFKEIYRVLKPGGKAIFLTPNTRNFNVWIIKAVPEKFHEFFTTRLYGRQENDTYPKFYRINSENKMIKILEPIGFQKTEIIVNGDPSYISFNRFLFKIACIIETILDLKPFRNCKVNIIGVFEKK